MIRQKLEGTFYMDGLLEGPLFSANDQSNINDFVKKAGTSGLKFHSAVNAGRFSLLPGTEPVEVIPGKSADEIIVNILNEFLKYYPPEECIKLMSTLRSMEYIPGHEIQTLYVIKPDGTAGTEQRTVKADTNCRPGPVDWHTRMKTAAFTAVILCAAVGVSAIFVPYRDIIKRIIERARPFKIQNLKIDAGVYEKFFLFESAELDRNNDLIRIVFKTTEQYPDTEDKMNAMWKSSENSASEHLAIEALMRNCVRAELFDRNGNFERQQFCYMKWKEDKKETFEITIPYDRYLGLVKISF